MFSSKNKRSKICFIGLISSLIIMLVVFFASDGLLGDKEFSKYTPDDWSVAILPLSIIGSSAIATLIFSLVLMVPIFRTYPSLTDYVANQKFANIDPETEFLVFDHNEFKRACCRTESYDSLWISIQEYDLKTRTWYILEKGRSIKANNINEILQEEYQYDKVKYYTAPTSHNNRR